MKSVILLFRVMSLGIILVIGMVCHIWGLELELTLMMALTDSIM